MSKSRLSLLLFPGKIWLLLALFGLFLAENRAESQVRGSELKFDISHFFYTIPSQLPVKKMVLTLSSFVAIGHKDFSILAAFLGTTPPFLK